MVFVFMKGSYKSTKDQTLQHLKVTTFLLIVVMLYLLAGALAFQFLNPEYASQGDVNNGLTNTTFTDSVYFMVVTLTTVGFGDVVPSNDRTKIFLVFYILASLFLVGVALEVTDFLFQINIEDLEQVDADNPKKFWTYSRKNLAFSIFLVFFVMFCSTLFFVLHEEFSVVDSIYFSVVTLTTVGYGDITPKTQNGKIFCIFWVGFGCLSLFRAVGALMDVMLESRKQEWARQREQKQEVLRRHLSSRVASIKMVNITATEAVEHFSKQELLDVLTKMEFFMYRLEKSGKMTIEDIKEMDEEYKKLSPEEIAAEFGDEHTSIVFQSMA